MPSTTTTPLLLTWHRRGLLRRLMWREVVGRYKGSWLGLSWSFLMPLFMLAIYSFVFGVVFKPPWKATTSSQIDFALELFAGLIVFNFFAEVLGSAPSVITAQPNYVKKVVFPLELLVLAKAGAALFHALMSLAILLAAVALTGRLTAWILAAPLVFAPVFACAVGLAWFLAALGVYVRDVAQVVGPALTALLFLSPVFYPIGALPSALQGWLWLNPLSMPIETLRSLAFTAAGIEADSLLLVGMALYTVAALTLAWLGFAWFARLKKGFADVL